MTNHDPQPQRLPIRGLIFDLDGTLVDSGLDFAAMRTEMELDTEHSILEALELLPPPRAAVCRQILARHEQAGVDRAVLLPGVAEFLGQVEIAGWRQAILTRNSREMSLATLSKFPFRFDPIVARDDAPPKPDPAAIWKICEAWGVTPAEVAVIGDYHFDLEAGRRAGARTVLYAGGRNVADIPYRGLADFVVERFDDAAGLLLWLSEST